MQSVPLGTLQKIKTWRDDCLNVQDEKRLKELKRQGIRIAMEFKLHFGKEVEVFEDFVGIARKLH